MSLKKDFQHKFIGEKIFRYLFPPKCNKEGLGYCRVQYMVTYMINMTRQASFCPQQHPYLMILQHWHWQHLPFDQKFPSQVLFGWLNKVGEQRLQCHSQKYLCYRLKKKSFSYQSFSFLFQWKNSLDYSIFTFKDQHRETPRRWDLKFFTSQDRWYHFHYMLLTNILNNKIVYFFSQLY